MSGWTTEHIDIRIPLDALLEIDAAADRACMSRSDYIVKVVLLANKHHRHNHIPATSVMITQTGKNPMLSISPGNSPEFVASLQPVNAGPFVPSNIVWSVTGDPGATVAQDPADATGESAILTLSSAVVLGAVLSLTVVVTNQDGSSVTATDTLTVVAVNTPPPPFVPATGVAIQQTV
jgi:hypothetical protein